MIEGSKYSVCPGCEALLVGEEMDCPNCGTILWSDGSSNPSSHSSGSDYVSGAGAYYEYGVFVAVTAENLAKMLNDLAANGWEPINVYGGTIPERPDETAHFAVMRRHNS